jgi:hypothetical protein
MSRLGEMLGGWEEPLQGGQLPVGANPGCRFYPKSGHNVCHAFLAFYESQGGPARFGYPISEFKLENDRIVQYFQGFRFDWYPEAPAGYQVRLAPLGRIHFQVMGYDQALLRPGLPGDMTSYRIVALKLQAAVWKPVVGPSDVQRVFLMVRDQNLQPVAGAAVMLVARFPDEERTYMLPTTDARGLSTFELAFQGQKPGATVALEFYVLKDEIQALTRDSFLIWW